MGSQYVLTPYVWPMIAAAICVAGLAVYGWSRRRVPAARPLALMATLAIPWALGAVLQVAAVDLTAKVVWFRFHVVWQLPAATAALWFALEYADIHVGRRVLALLAVPPVLVMLLIVTDATHHLMWTGFSFDGRLHSEPGVANVIAISYATLVVLATLKIFFRLFLSSPPHRHAAALCLGGLLLINTAYVLDAAGANPVEPMDLSVLSFPFTVAMYALAQFRFRMFDLIPVARSTVVEQMGQGMLVLNAAREIVDLNPAAERMLGIDAARARGKILREVLPDFPLLTCVPPELEAMQSEVSLTHGGVVRHYAVHHSPLVHRRGLVLGCVILLRDVTGERETHVRLLEHQKALATLRERDRVARELHDSLGQVVGYVKMQAQAARELLARDRRAEAEGCLGQLVAVAQDAHADVRDYIYGAQAAMRTDAGFIPALEHYLERYSRNCGISTTLDVAPTLHYQSIEPTVTSQLLRVMQEALTNVRKHAAASAVHVRLAIRDGCLEAIVQDNGAGFDPALYEGRDRQSFGIGVMRERAAEVGANLRITSAPGQGTEVAITVPLRRHHEAVAR